jgi:hypothetical protein
MKPEDDDALRDALADAHHGARTPSFRELWDPARRPTPVQRSPLPWLVTCASLLAALGLTTWLVGRLGPPPAQIPAGTRWVGPTDFLLDTPDMVTLRTIPELVPSLEASPLKPRVHQGTP